MSQEGITGLIEPINTRITDPRYFLDSPHQGKLLRPTDATRLLGPLTLILHLWKHLINQSKLEYDHGKKKKNLWFSETVEKHIINLPMMVYKDEQHERSPGVEPEHPCGSN